MNSRGLRRGAARALLSLMLMLLVPATLIAGAVPERQTLVSQPTSYNGVVTVKTRVKLSPAGETRNEGGDEGVWLAGLAASPGAEPQVLALTWSPVSSGWFGAIWGLQLQSAEGLIPDNLYPRSGADFLAGSSYLAVSSSLLWGNEYESMLSYDPNSGAASVVITDLTAGKTVASHGFQLKPYAGAVYPSAGYRVDANAGAPIELASVASLEARGVFAPAGVPWYWVQAPADSDVFDIVGELDRRSQSGIRMDFPWSSVPGELRVMQEVSPGNDVLLATAQDLSGSVVVPISTADLSVGTLRIRPELVVGDDVWPQEAKQTMYGIVRMRLESVEPRTQSDGSVAFEGRLSVQNDGPVAGARVTVIADVMQYDEGHESKPLENAVVLDFDLSRAGLAESLTLPFRVQLPPADGAGNSERWWLAHLVVAVEPDTLGVRAISQDWVISPIITAQVQLKK